MSKLAVLDLRDVEVVRAWGVVCVRVGDVVAARLGESWAYKWTEYRPQLGRWVHFFRHLRHPLTGMVEVCHVDAGVSWEPPLALIERYGGDEG